MALPPNSQLKHGSGARFRQRKISVKQPLVIYKQKELPVLDLSHELEPLQINHLNATGTQQRDGQVIETGVDKNEEDEVHLQQVINAAQRALKDGDKKEEKSTSVYIPTPDASRLWSDASKYYQDSVFVQPDSYIKFSATVEDTLGVEYNMDEQDEEFLQKYNSEASGNKIMAEVEFEIICDKLERTIEEKQPFLVMEPSGLLSYKELSQYILEEFLTNKSYASSVKYMLTSLLKEKLLKEVNYKPFMTIFDKNLNVNGQKVRLVPKLFSLFGEEVYKHWKSRKLERKGKSIVPSLKFEDPNANEKENDADPYVCFRRREFRQARKTRRADTLGAERIRVLQKLIRRAHDLIKMVSIREVWRLDQIESDHEIFKLRCEAKNLKRSAGIKGDDYLFYPHKRKKPVVKVEEEEVTRKPKKPKQEVGREPMVSREKSSLKDIVPSIQQEVATANALTQPYIKLPPLKIPDMDLVTVSLVLKEKNETIKRAVLEKLRKRKEQDNNFVNFTDDPYQPFFNITTRSKEIQEYSHIPYLLIALLFFHEVNTTNYISEELKKELQEGKQSLPGVKTFKGLTGELIPLEPFPHLQTLSEDTQDYQSNGYIAQFLRNIETNNFNVYSAGYEPQQLPEQHDETLCEPIFRMRKRVSRSGRVFIDRRGLLKLSDFQASAASESTLEPHLESQSEAVNVKAPNVYDSVVDSRKRLESRWKFDDDEPEYDKGIREPFLLDPSKLNCISNDTQAIRFGLMLLLKLYDLFRESVHQRQQLLIQQARMRALQHQQLQSRQQQQLQQEQLAQQQFQGTPGQNNKQYAQANKSQGGSPSGNSGSQGTVPRSSVPGANQRLANARESPLLASQQKYKQVPMLPMYNNSSK